MLRRGWMIALTLLIGNLSWAQEKTNDVHLFQTFFQDAAVATQPYGEGFFQCGGRLRGCIGVGLDDGAPNFSLRFGYLLGF